jgi:hypothetical protein
VNQTILDLLNVVDGKKIPPRIRRGGVTNLIIPQNDTDSKFKTYQKLFSTERLEKFIANASNLSDALELYRLDVQISAQIFELLNYFEVSLRNTVNNAFTAEYGENWREQTELFNQYARSCIDRSHQLSDFNFGFWVHVFGNALNGEYDKKLWSQAIFPCLQNCRKSERKKIHHVLITIREMRNRIAHHEPIIFDIHVKKENGYFSVQEILDNMVYIADKIDDTLVDILIRRIGEGIK